MTTHEISRITRDHIILDLGVPNFHISIVEERGSYYSCKELALMCYKRADSLLHRDSLSCVRLHEWYDPNADEGELTINLEYSKTPEAIVVATAITRALEFINKGDK